MPVQKTESSRVKKKRILKSGAIRKKAHISSTGKKTQASRDGKNVSVVMSSIKKPKATKKKVAQKTTKKLKYVGVEKSEALDAYVRKHCNGLLRRISVHPSKYKLKFCIRPEARKIDHSISSFSVEGAIVITGRTELRAKAKAKDVKVAIDKVIKNLEVKVRRDTEKRERSRKTIGKSLKPVTEYRWELSLNSK